MPSRLKSALRFCLIWIASVAGAAHAELPSDSARGSQVATLAVADARLITVKPWEKNLVPAIDKAIPAQFRDKDGEYFVDAYRARGIIVSKDRVKPGAITSYEDLTKPEWQGKVCSRSGKHDYNIAIFDQMYKSWGEEKSKKVISGIAKNLARAPEGDDRERRVPRGHHLRQHPGGDDLFDRPA